MRETFQNQLGQLGDHLGQMCAVVASAMEKATIALLESDLQLAKDVISNDTRIDELRAIAEDRSYAALALQAPVATDLRVVLSVIHAAGDLERMGDLALHVAEAARRRYPEHVLPEQIRPYFAEMGRVAVALALKAGEGVRPRGPGEAPELEGDDDAVGDLHPHNF